MIAALHPLAAAGLIVVGASALWVLAECAYRSVRHTNRRAISHGRMSDRAERREDGQ